MAGIDNQQNLYGDAGSATYYLVKRWVRMGSRTRDQMEQSARSGKQNIVEGGIRERMTQARLAARDPQPAPPDQPAPPACPLWQKPMRQRTARQGRNAGQPFWGCSAYPDCKGTRPV
jgi:hypothetical protein